MRLHETSQRAIPDQIVGVSRHLLETDGPARLQIERLEQSATVRADRLAEDQLLLPAGCELRGHALGVSAKCRGLQWKVLASLERFSLKLTWRMPGRETAHPSARRISLVGGK